MIGALTFKQLSAEPKIEQATFSPPKVLHRQSDSTLKFFKQLQEYTNNYDILRHRLFNNKPK